MKFLVFILSVVLFTPTLVLAQAQSQQRLEVQGLALTPFLIETEVESGKEQLQTITLTNTTETALPIEISINDFVPSQGGGEPTFLNSDQTSDPKFSLSSWIKITQQPSFTIPARGQTTVQFSITPPADAEPGTHYGGLLFSYRPTIDPNKNVQIKQKAGVLVLAQLGHADELAAITTFRAEPSLDYQDVNFFLSVYNQGNVHIKPKGDIYISNMFGQQVADIQVNRDAAIILPQSQRNFQTNWKAGWRLGRYTATAVLFYGNPKLEVRSQTAFWVVPWQRLSLVVILFVIFCGLGYTAIKRYNRWLISRPNQS